MKRADGLIESFFNDKHFKPDNAQEFDKICQRNLEQCLLSFRNLTDTKRTEKTASSVLRVVHKLIVDFHMRRIRHPKRLTLLCWEWDSKMDRYKTGGDMSRWEIEVCRGVGHVKQYCAQKFDFAAQNIHIVYQGRHLRDDERFRDVCVQKGSFINMIFLRPEDKLTSVNLDVAEMEHGTPQECIEKSTLWFDILKQLLDDELVGEKVSSLSWDVMRALPRRSCYQHLLTTMSDRKQIFDGEIALPKELAGLIGEFVPSTIQDIYLERTNGDPAGVDITKHDNANNKSATPPRGGEAGEAPLPASQTNANDADARGEGEAGEARDPTLPPTTSRRDAGEMPVSMVRRTRFSSSSCASSSSSLSRSSRSSMSSSRSSHSSSFSSSSSSSCSLGNF